MSLTLFTNQNFLLKLERVLNIFTETIHNLNLSTEMPFIKLGEKIRHNNLLFFNRWFFGNTISWRCCNHRRIFIAQFHQLIVSTMLDDSTLAQQVNVIAAIQILQSDIRRCKKFVWELL